MAAVCNEAALAALEENVDAQVLRLWFLFILRSLRYCAIGQWAS